MTTIDTTTAPRTLTETLRRLDATELADLLVLRPDLAHPAPRDIADLSAQATTTSSVSRAVDTLNAWQRVVAEAIAALPDPVTLPEVAALLGIGPRPAPATPKTLEAPDPPETPVAAEPTRGPVTDRDAELTEVATAVQDLRARALLWGADDELHLVRAARDHLGPYAGGLAPPSPRPLATADIDPLLAEAGPEARAVVDRLLWSPAGAVTGADRAVTVDNARTPVERLLARRLLRPAGSDTVLLPREVAWHLRDRRFSPVPVPAEAPAISGRVRTPALVDRAAVGAAYGLVHDVELLAHTLETSAYRLLREGGVSLRDVAGLGRELGTDPVHATFVVEVAAAAGLIAAGDGNRLLPTADYDRWAEQEPADRWRALVAAWRHSERLAGLSSEPGGHPLGPESEAPAAAPLRSLVTDLLAGVEVGTTLDLDDLHAAIGWHRPRLVRVGGVPLASVLAWTWREAGWLGIASLNTVSGLAAGAVSADTLPLPAALAAAFPAVVEQIVLQADLTAVAPGPVPYRLARDLRLLADQESRGGAAVFRFSATSLRRGFDTGWSAADVHRWLAHHASTQVPQPLAYLIDDVARQHGSIRVGPARAYVQLADSAQVAAVLAHPDAAVLGLRELADGILVAAAEPYEVVDFLHRIGHSPAAEDASGRSITAPDPLRSPRRPGHRPRPDVQAGETAAAVLLGEQNQHEGRVRERAPGPSSTSPDQRTTAEILTELATAQRSGETVRIRYVAADGRPAVRALRAVLIESGLVHGSDAETTHRVSIPLSRVSSVQPAIGPHAVD